MIKPDTGGTQISRAIVISVTDSKIVDALQEKLNDYMDYVISKQYEELYNPEAYDKIAIKIVAKNPFSNEGIRCLNIAKNIIEDAGYYLEWEKHQ